MYRSSTFDYLFIQQFVSLSFVEGFCCKLPAETWKAGIQLSKVTIIGAKVSYMHN